MVEANKTYVGVVEDNNDPKKMGRVKVRVMDVFDDIKVEDIPWAMPWKDLNGNSFNVPEKGKVVIVVFDQGKQDSPEFIYSDHYNINLENKISSLSESDYISMKSLIFDHKTQIYVNDSEGLKIDHKYHNINITDNGIDLNLKDNNTNINIGDSTAGQQAILGNHWMDWFDEFVDNLLGSNAGPFLGNLGAPVIPNPALISCLLKYKSLRNPVFLSHHVNIVDNNKVSTVRTTKREDTAQVGDNWVSTKEENTITSVTDDNFVPEEGPKKEYDPNYVAPPVDGSTTKTNTNPSIDLTSPESNPMVDKLIKFMKSKSYVVYDKPDLLNIVAMRTKDDGVVTNKFDDVIYVFFRNKKNNWEFLEYQATTTPGFKPKTEELPERVAILKLGQYVDQCKLDYIKTTDSKIRCLKISRSVIHINNNIDKYNYNSPTVEGEFEINIHSVTTSTENVFNLSEGSQVFKNINQFNQFVKLCETQETSGKNTFTYTICRKSEFDEFTP